MRFCIRRSLKQKNKVHFPGGFPGNADPTPSISGSVFSEPDIVVQGIRLLAEYGMVRDRRIPAGSLKRLNGRGGRL